MRGTCIPLTAGQDTWGVPANPGQLARIPAVYLQTTDTWPGYVWGTCKPRTAGQDTEKINYKTSKRAFPQRTFGQNQPIKCGSSIVNLVVVAT